MSGSGKLVLALSATLFFTNCLSALQVSPLRTIAQVEAGQKTTGAITLINDKNFPVNVEIALEKSVQFENKKNDAGWFTLDQDDIIIEPGGNASLEYKVLVPEGSVAFLDKPSNPETAALVSLNTKISIPLFFSVKGTEVYDFEVLDFKLDKNSKSEADVFIFNQGNVHIRPIGTCSIRSIGKDSIIESLIINGDGYPIFPGAKQKFRINLSNLLTPYLGENHERRTSS